MSRPDITDKWLFVAYSAKRDGTEEMEQFDKCLSRSIKSMGIKTKLIFGDWIESMEEETLSEGKDLFRANARVHSVLQTQLKDVVLDDASTGFRVCFEQMEI